MVKGSVDLQQTARSGKQQVKVLAITSGQGAVCKAGIATNLSKCVTVFLRLLFGKEDCFGKVVSGFS